LNIGSSHVENPFHIFKEGNGKLMKLPPLMAEEINKALKMCFEKKRRE
jgi:hypothetical protein